MFYLTNENLPFFIPLGFIGVYRWFWFIVRVLAYIVYKPIQPRKHPRYKPHKDVTIVVPTIDADENIKKALQSWLKNNPYEVIFVTIPSAKPSIEALIHEVDPQGLKVRVITVSKPNKRNQMVAGANHVKTEITVYCDDDVLWPPTMLEYMLAPFEDKQMGGVGTSQKAIPLGKKMTLWEVLAAYRISMRNIEIVSTTYIDGGVCCLSGRTAAYRSRILRDPEFQWAFTHEFWLGKYHQHSGDDKFLTRWIHSHYWKTHIQACPEAELCSTFKASWLFLKQLLRWTRNTWRSDMRSLITERYLWSRHPFTAFTMLDKFFNMITLLAGPITVGYLCTRSDAGLPAYVIIISYVCWLLISRLVKYMPHFIRRPWDILYLPIWIIFTLFFALLKIYCLFTLHVTNWGTRKGADDKHEEKEDLDIYTPHWNDPPAMPTQQMSEQQQPLLSAMQQRPSNQNSAMAVRNSNMNNATVSVPLPVGQPNEQVPTVVANSIPMIRPYPLPAMPVSHASVHSIQTIHQQGWNGQERMNQNGLRVVNEHVINMESTSSASANNDNGRYLSVNNRNGASSSQEFDDGERTRTNTARPE